MKERKEADTHNIRRELRKRLNIAVTSRWKKDIQGEREKTEEGGIVTVIGWQLSCASIREVTNKG